MAEQDTATEEIQALPRWLDELRPGGVGEGFIEKHLRHSLMFVRRPVKRLLITFDNLANVGNTAIDREPWAFKFAQDINISHLGIMAHVSDWYRDPELIGRMQKLADEGFFDGYDRVVFAGVSMGGFASIAFASLVPGAHVVSVNPQSTLDTGLVPWETRYESGRRQDWTLPLSDAAALTQGLGRVNIFYDPYHELDQQHVNRFSGDNIRIFKCRYSNHKTAVFMRKIGILKPVMHHAIFDELTEQDFYRLYRERRKLPWFRGSLAAYFERTDRPHIAEHLSVLFRKNLRRIKRLEAKAADAEEKVVVEKVPTPKPVTPVAERPPGRPQGQRNNDRCGIVTTMKNEGPFMLEWVAHNRAIGFSDIVIYTNDCDDGTDRIGMRLEELGVARHIDNKMKKGGSPQRAALRKVRKEPFYKECDWVICADCDEFLNIRAGDGRLPDLFEAVGEADAISFCWKIFGRGDHVKYEDRFVTEMFTWGAQEDFRAKYRSIGLKTMFRPSEVIRMFGVHRPKFFEPPKNFIWTDSGGQPMPDKYFELGWSAHKGFTNTHARLHHYAVRSIDSFLVKRDRGRTNHVDRDQGVAYWADMNLNMEEDRSLALRTDRTRVEFEKLMADPEIARLHGEAVDWHRGKIKSLKEQDEWAAFHELLQMINRPGEEPVNRDQLIQDLAAE